MNLLERITKKIIAPVLITGSFVFANSSFSQEKKDFVNETYATGRIGFYSDGDKDIKEMYGPFFTFGFGFQRDFSQSIRGELGGDYSLTDGEENHSDNNLSIMSFLGSLNLDFAGIRKNYPKKSAFMYARAGILYNQIKEKRHFSDGEITGNTNGFGIIFGGGINFLIKDEEIRKVLGCDELFLEYSQESVSTKKMERNGSKIIFGLRNKI